MSKKYRIYFNCRADAPYVWSYDEGPGTEEHIVKTVHLRGCNADFVFDGSKHLPQASAWIEIVGVLTDEEGVVTVTEVKKSASAA